MEFMDTAEACALLHISRPWLRELARTKRLPSYKAGRKFLFRRDDLLKYMTYQFAKVEPFTGAKQ